MNTVLQFPVMIQPKPVDVPKSKKPKDLAPIKKQLALIKKGQYTKSDVGALTKLVASRRFSDGWRSQQIFEFVENNFKCVDNIYLHSNFQGEVMHFNKIQNLTKEQTALGKAWLKNYFYNSKGVLRSSKDVKAIQLEHSNKVTDIAKNVSRFKFVGIMVVSNSHGYANQCLPIYRAFNKKGEYFDYAPIHWGQPVIMENY